MSIASANPVLPALLAEGGGTMSLFEYVRAGGSLGYVLIALSVLAVALVVRNLLVLRKSLLAPEDLVTRLSGMLRSGDVAGAARACAEDPAHSFVAGVMQSAIRRCSANPMGAFEARAAVEEAGQVATAKLQRLNNGLGVLAAVGPMLGLLGTVIGMIGAFNAIGSLQGAARSTELARFMSLALVNTAQGLVVAVPCTVAFALFRQRIDRMVTDVAADVLEPLSDDLAAGLSMAARPGAQAVRATPTAAAPARPAPTQGA
jgi:biopolymer transport protein ExbB